MRTSKSLTLPLRILVCIALGAATFSCGGSSSPAAGGSVDTVAGYGTQPAVATVPSSNLIVPGRLLMCTDVGTPPDEFYNAQGQLVGHDIDTGNVIAARLRLSPQWIDSVFDTIILAANTGKCDIIIDGMGMTAPRGKAIKQIPYFTGGDRLLVKSGNPSNITGIDNLCGKSVAVLLGAVEQDYVNGYSATCTSAGKPAVKLVVEQKLPTAVLAVGSGLVDTALIDSDYISYLKQTQPTVFDAVGSVLHGIPQSMNVSYSKPELIAAVTTVVQSMEKDGTLLKIMTNWGVQVKPIPPIDYMPPGS